MSKEIGIALLALISGYVIHWLQTRRARKEQHTTHCDWLILEMRKRGDWTDSDAVEQRMEARWRQWPHIIAYARTHLPNFEQDMRVRLYSTDYEQLIQALEQYKRK